MSARVALVLHAHLPYVLGDAPGSLEESWLLSALWESYLPLLDVIDRLGAPITVSISPPLGSMLADPRLASRFEHWLDRLEEANHGARHDAAIHYAALLARARAGFAERGGDLLAAFAAHHRAGRIELLTTSASHALLPCLAPVPGAIEAQLALGRQSFERLAGITPRGMWLPECAVSEAVDAALTEQRIAYTVVDEHAVALSSARAPAGCPIVGPGGVVYLPRCREATLRVWSRARGYPRHPCYREFHRDRDPYLPGLKYHAIGGGLYQPEPAREQARRDARDLVEHLEARPLSVLAFDAELFGHWWHEGPWFLEELSSRLGSRLCTLQQAASDAACWPLAMPATSSWGRGGFFEPWLGERTARWWPRIHRTHARVRARPHPAAIRELMLLEASDWLFLLDAGSFAEAAERRLERHSRRALALLDGASAAEHDGYLAELTDAELLERFAGGRDSCRRWSPCT